MTDKQKNRLVIGGVILAVILFLLFSKSKAVQDIIQNIAGDFTGPSVSGNDINIPETTPYKVGLNSACSLCLTRAPAIIMPSKPQVVTNNFETIRYVTQNYPVYGGAQPQPRNSGFSFASAPLPSNGRADATGRYPDGSLSRFW